MQRFFSSRLNLGFVMWIALAFAALVLAVYFFQFRGALSKTSAEWANFGSYVGGTLGPVYAFMAFIIGLRTLQQAAQQARRDELLKVIQGYERDFESCVSKPVACQEPWIWGHRPSASSEINEVALRTLLVSDGVDWEGHLPDLASSLAFRVLPHGELVQDRDIFLQAHLAVEGIFRYLALYHSAGGDASPVACRP